MEGDFDACGYEPDSIISVDTRNTKYQARINHNSLASSNKSHNVLQMAKLNSKQQAKEQREHQRVMEMHMMKQMKLDNERWSAVDEEDARHMKREAEKRRKE